MEIDVVYSPAAIAKQVDRVADEIAAAKYEDLVFLILLRGGVIFGADLVLVGQL